MVTDVVVTRPYIVPDKLTLAVMHKKMVSVVIKMMDVRIWLMMKHRRGGRGHKPTMQTIIIRLINN